MKKLALTIALIIGITTYTFAQEYTGDRGLFGRGGNQESSWGWDWDEWIDGLFQYEDYEEYRGDGDLNLPGQHGSEDDFDGPLGSGVAVLLGFGAAYLVRKKRKNLHTMKKTIMTVAIVLGLGLTTFANPDGGGMFQRGEAGEGYTSGWMNRDGGSPVLPNHGQSTNQNAPLGSGIALLTALGAAYLVGKKRKED